MYPVSMTGQKMSAHVDDVGHINPGFDEHESKGYVRSDVIIDVKGHKNGGVLSVSFR